MDKFQEKGRRFPCALQTVEKVRFRTGAGASKPPSDEGGTNENTNGLIREYTPKGKDIAELTDAQIAKIVDDLNHRPRKCLNWRTPIEVHFKKVLHLT